MGLKISSSNSFKIQPLKKNGWIFQFSAIPGNTSAQAEALAFVAKSATAPSISFGDLSTSRLNETFNYAGKHTWNEIPCTFYDYIRNSSATSGELSAGDILYNWSCMVYNPLTGQNGYKTQYATSATLAQIDPAGNIIRAWNLFGIFPKTVDFGGQLDYTQDAICEISATFKYDLAIKVPDSKTASESA